MIRKSLVYLSLVCAHSCFAQGLNYFKVHMGPKIESYTSDAPNAKGLINVNAGAGVSVGKLFTEQVYVELGLYKNDYSARYELTSVLANGQEVKTAGSSIYPTFSTTQLASIVGCRFNPGFNWQAYAEAGLHFFVARKLDREGSSTYNETAQNDETGDATELSIIEFSNGLEPGNLLFRGNVGVYRALNERLSLDISISGRISTLPLNEFQVDYTEINSPNQNKQTARFSTNGAQIGLYFGIKYNINPFRQS